VLTGPAWTLNGRALVAAGSAASASLRRLLCLTFAGLFPCISNGRKTGFWLEELAAPYYVFKDAGAQITLASPKGGRPPLDLKSNEPNFQTDITRRFEKDTDAEAQLSKTVRLDGVKQEDYDTVFYPGGHGPMWDIAEDKNSIKLIESFLAAGKYIALVCHAPGALRHVKTRHWWRGTPRRRISGPAQMTYLSAEAAPRSLTLG
jgi:putative intracellular protease/amidase